MDIARATEQVKNALTAYLATDEFGDYLLPVESQRPVFLMGPPGIGKTAVMKQIAMEMGIGLVSYSMTHHTRQSALGLPYIASDEFRGESYRISRYTMSEIIASVHGLIKDTGLDEGILFLDEVNCVSETLAPAMLQFLQFKTFGQHRIPDGWIIACAGNPPEYNNSVREFDIVTWDRLKRIDIEPDYEAWKTYAIQQGVHPAVTTYLELKKQNFYKVESTAQGKRFVTARGWVDLSNIIRLYEHCGIAVDADLTAQYLQDPEISRDFANYYQLFDKYKADYQVREILDGKRDPEILERLGKAAFDERLSVLGMVLDACTGQVDEAVQTQEHLAALLQLLLQVRDEKAHTPVPELVEQHVRDIREQVAAGSKAGLLTRRAKRLDERKLAFLVDARAGFAQASDAYAVLRDGYNAQLDAFKEQVAAAKSTLDNAFVFLEEAFGEGQEMLIFVTDLTANETCARFISNFGCDKYFEHNKELMFYERQKEIIEELNGLDL